MPAGPCTGAPRRKLPTGHPSVAGPPGHRSLSGASAPGYHWCSRRPARLHAITRVKSLGRYRGITATRPWSGSRPSASAVTSRSRIAAGAAGRARRRRGTRCMPTGGGSAARAGNGCCGSGAATGTAQPASLRDRPDATRPSARTSQHSETAARPGLRRQSWVAHAAPDGRGHAAEPPGPRRGASGPPSATIGRIRRGMVRRHANTDTRFSIDTQPLLPRAARPQLPARRGSSRVVADTIVTHSACRRSSQPLMTWPRYGSPVSCSASRGIIRSM